MGISITTTTTTTAHVSTVRFNSVLFPTGHVALNRGQQQQQQFQVVRCALYPEKRRESRRLVSASLLLFLNFLSLPKDAKGGSFLDKYVKKKKLDPLEVYVPAVILAQLQIQELGQSLESEQPRYVDCRSLLRSGPAASLRVNIRAVAQYASDGGNGKSAFNNVDQCLRSLEELDSLLLRASRNESGVSVESMKTEVTSAVNALDSLLNTVPSDVLSKGKAIADAYQTREDVAPDDQDPELKQLESLL